MPRDLFPTKPSSEPVITASPSPEIISPYSRPMEPEEPEDSGNSYSIFRDERDGMEVALSAKFKVHDDLHPHVQVLSISDVEACVALENACFPENERCSREKFIYRLTTTPSLSLGLYTSTSNSPTPETETLHSAARAPDSSKPNHKSLLIGHVIAILTTSPTITDSSMDFPRSFPSHPQHTSTPANPTSISASISAPNPDTAGATSQAPTTTHPNSGDSAGPSSPAPELGHNPLGRTLAIHSVAIHPSYQKLGLGKTLLKAYLQRMEGAGVADRAVLIARPGMVGWYVGQFGFEDRGTSGVKFAPRKEGEKMESGEGDEGEEKGSEGEKGKGEDGESKEGKEGEGEGSGWRDLVYDFQDSGLWA